jgi:hypothetical protein
LGALQSLIAYPLFRLTICLATGIFLFDTLWPENLSWQYGAAIWLFFAGICGGVFWLSRWRWRWLFGGMAQHALLQPLVHLKKKFALAKAYSSPPPPVPDYGSPLLEKTKTSTSGKTPARPALPLLPATVSISESPLEFSALPAPWTTCPKGLQEEARNSPPSGYVSY